MFVNTFLGPQLKELQVVPAVRHFLSHGFLRTEPARGRDWAEQFLSSPELQQVDVLARLVRLVCEERDLLLEAAGLFEELVCAAEQLRASGLPARLALQLLGGKLNEMFPTEGALNLYLTVHSLNLDEELRGRSWHSGAVEDDSQPDGLGMLGLVAKYFLHSESESA